MKKEQWYPFVMLGCATAVNFVYLGMACNVLGLYTPSILAEFPAFSRSAFAVTVTLVNLMAAVGNMLHEPVLRRMPVRGMLCLGLCTVMLGLLAYSLADRLSLFYLGGGFLGLGIGFCSSGTVALMVNAWFAKRSGTFVSVAMSGTGISVALFSPIVSRMIDAWGWRAAFRMMGVLVAVFGLLIVCVYRSTPKAAGLPGRWGEEKDGTPRAEEKESRRGSLWKNPVYRAFMALIFLMGIVLYAVMNNISVIASDMNFSIIQIGYFSSVIFVVNVVSQLPVGMTCDRFGSRGILYAAFR